VNGHEVQPKTSPSNSQDTTVNSDHRSILCQRLQLAHGLGVTRNSTICLSDAAHINRTTASISSPATASGRFDGQSRRSNRTI